MRNSPTQLIELDIDERQDCLLEAGTRIVVLEGSIRLYQGLVWLAAQCVLPRQSLYADQSWQAERGGWITLCADCPCSLLILSPEPGILRKASQHLQRWLNESPLARREQI